MSNTYIILTDSCCDLPDYLVRELELSVTPLSLLLDDKEYFNYLDEREITFEEFYGKLRQGKSATTSAVNTTTAREAMEPILKAGKDVLYLGFSSGLSSTYSAFATAAKELMEEYPGRKAYAVDTLCASLGQGMLIYYAAKKRQEGASIEEVRDFVESRRLNLCHWFTVDDLNHLKRGGRISAATAAVGTVLSIKPVMHVDNEGHLVAIGKARGRKAAIKAITKAMEDAILPGENPVAFISHGGCLEDAEYVAAQMKERMGVGEVIINYVGPVIGAHTGAGVLAIFCWGSAR